MDNSPEQDFYEHNAFNKPDNAKQQSLKKDPVLIGLEVPKPYLLQLYHYASFSPLLPLAHGRRIILFPLAFVAH